MKIIKYENTSHVPILMYIHIFLILLYPFPASLSVSNMYFLRTWCLDKVLNYGVKLSILDFF